MAQKSSAQLSTAALTEVSRKTCGGSPNIALSISSVSIMLKVFEGQLLVSLVLSNPLASVSDEESFPD